MPRSRNVQPPATDPNAFFAQPHEAMVAALITVVPPPEPTSASVARVRPARDTVAALFGEALRTAKALQQAGVPIELRSSAASLGGHHQPLRNPIEVAQHYERLRADYRTVVAAWKATLPPTKRSERNDPREAGFEVREAAQGHLHAALHAKFPDMRAVELNNLTRSEVTRQEHETRRDALRTYLGRQLGRSGATVRDAIRAAGHARRRWQPFLAWVSRTLPKEFAKDIAALVQILEWYRGGFPAPVPADFYPTFGPLFFDLVRMLRSAPPEHPKVAAVNHWLQSLTPNEADRAALAKLGFSH